MVLNATWAAHLIKKSPMNETEVAGSVETVLIKLATEEWQDEDKRRRLIADIREPDWGHNDWHAYVPVEIENLWSTLSWQGQLLTYLTANEQAKNCCRRED